MFALLLLRFVIRNQKLKITELIQAAEIIVVTIERIQRALLSVAFLITTILLARFTIDFFIQMPLWLALPFLVLVAASLVIAAMNLLALLRRPSDQAFSSNLSAISTGLLLASIPLGFLASTFDCSGLALQGCSPFCTVIKLLGIPLMVAVCTIYFFNPAKGLLMAIIAMSFVPLVPHCICYNVGNYWWIRHFGASPMCYVWGFVVTLISASAMKSGARVWLSLLVNGAIIGGAMTFFISHHYFHFPW
jgi:hypothetical protein